MADVIIEADIPDEAVASFLKSLDSFAQSNPGDFMFRCAVKSSKKTVLDIKETMDTIPGATMNVINISPPSPLEVN